QAVVPVVAEHRSVNRPVGPRILHDAIRRLSLAGRHDDALARFERIEMLERAAVERPAPGDHRVAGLARERRADDVAGSGSQRTAARTLDHDLVYADARYVENRDRRT